MDLGIENRFRLGSQSDSDYVLKIDFDYVLKIDFDEVLQIDFDEVLKTLTL